MARHGIKNAAKNDIHDISTLFICSFAKLSQFNHEGKTSHDQSLAVFLFGLHEFKY